jgi:(R,R)-butanediol dehydrogenase/meso-butanediol dehydrogenase/diacetyl reductase
MRLKFPDRLLGLEPGGEKMKAAILRGKKHFSIEEVPTPAAGTGEVVVKVSYCAVCGSDISRFVTGRGVGLIIGHEFCGKIAEVGPGVEGWSVGDRVVVDPITQCNRCYFCLRDQGNLCLNLGGTGIAGKPGGYAEYAKTIPAQLFHAPDGVEEKEATMAQCLAVALHAIHLSEIKMGDRVIVVGAGPIGLLVVACAKLAGAASVYVIEIADARKAVATKFGADAVIDPTEMNSRERILELTGIGGDIVFMCSNNPGAVQHAFALPRAGGVIVLVGNHWTAEINAEFVDTEVTVKGLKAYWRREFGEAVDLIASGRISCKSLITDIEPLHNIQQAFEALQNPTTQVKTLIAP